MIKKKDLIKDAWYYGKGRNSNTGMWTDKTFIVIGNTFDRYRMKEEDHWHDGGPFKPIRILDRQQRRYKP